MFFAVSFLQDALGVPSTKVPIGATMFVSYVIPPVVCYIIAAVLAVMPQTRVVRAALCPVVALLAMRAALSVDLSLGNPEQKSFDVGFVFFMISIAVHSLAWTLAKKPFVRYLRPANSSPSTIMDALDLATNFRGHGWEWSRGLYVPHETRPTNRIAFAFYALLSGVAHGLIYSALQFVIHAFTAGVGSSTQGSPVFDETLPFLVQYLRASIISTMTGVVIHTGSQMTYDLLTVPAILLFGQDPAQWPPVFDNPWCATSLSDFWGRRWHQLYRHTFLLGAYPFSIVLGRAGTVMGAFLSSALLHHLLTILLDSQSEMWRMLVGFGMMAPGILAERAFYRLTGRKVGGVVGWVWTMAWLLLWGNVIVDGFLRAGMFMPSGATGSQLPVRALIENLVIDFDAWLHTI